jgi:DegV family protein with EDD domain
LATVIFTDSGSDCSRSEAQGAGIHMVPIWINFGSERFRDGIDIDRAKFFNRIRAGEQPHTDPPSAEEWKAAFAPIVDAGNEIVCVTIAAQMSKSYEGALAAAKDFGGKVHVVDSLGAGPEELLITYYAKELAENGASAADVAQKCAPRALKASTFFAVPNLTQLGKSGRLPKAVVSLGSMLNVSLVLKINELGAVAPAGQAFSFDKAIELMVDACVRAIGHASNARVAFSNVESPDMIEATRAAFEKKLGHPPMHEFVRETTLTLASHTGIGALGISAIVP